MLFVLGFMLFSSLGSKQDKENNKENPSGKSEASVAHKPDSVINTSDAYLVLKKTSCYGRCPEYTFYLYPDLTCKIDAKRFYKVEGVKKGEISRKQMETIKSKVEIIDFFNLKDSYDNEFVQDVPPTYVSISNGGAMKKIKSRYGSPKELIEFQDVLVQIIDKVEWK